VVATAYRVVIRFCTACGAYWSEEPASRPAVISRKEAARRVPDASGWRGLGPRLTPDDPMALLVDIQRLDAHQADVHGLHAQAELPGDVTVRGVLIRVIEPFLWKAPRTSWLCRASSDGQWTDLAVVVTTGPSQGSRLLMDGDASAREFAGQPLLEIACRPD